MAKKRVEKLNDAFPDFVDEADLSLDRILDSITASNLPIPDENAAAPHSDINSFDSFYQNKISETCDDILMLEKNAATIVQADIENLYKGSFVREGYFKDVDAALSAHPGVGHRLTEIEEVCY